MSSWLFCMTAVVTFLADRLTKMAALSFLASGAVTLFPGLSFSLAFNTGISFSLFSSWGANSWLLSALIATIVAVLVISWRFLASSTTGDIGYGLIIGGAIGNMFDRLYMGGVIDFIDLHWGAWHWPTFNIADTAICIGFICILSEEWHAKAP